MMTSSMIARPGPPYFSGIDRFTRPRFHAFLIISMGYCVWKEGVGKEGREGGKEGVRKEGMEGGKEGVGKEGREGGKEWDSEEKEAVTEEGREGREEGREWERKGGRWFGASTTKQDPVLDSIKVLSVRDPCTEEAPGIEKSPSRLILTSPVRSYSAATGIISSFANFLARSW